MLKDWFFGKIKAQALNTGAKEIEKFNAGLKAMSGEDLGAVVAIATVIRINFETNDVIPEGVFEDGPLPSTDAIGRYQLRINKVARQFRKMGLGADSAGAMVWSYTLRCLNVPELRPLGVEMWAELRRGLPHAEDALSEGEKEKGEPFPDRVWSGWKMTPAGF
jgi:hypothetical protein